MFAFASQFLLIVAEIGKSINFDSSGFAIDLSQTSVTQGDFLIFVILNLFISSVMASIIVAQIQKGKMIYALPSIPVFFGITVFLFWISSRILEGVFAVII
ncbi:MAG: hypothetical protein ACI8Y7_000193 [Candidatus Woesearchaeota archaeon]